MIAPAGSVRNGRRTMSLLVLMYHRARSGQHGNSAEMLDAHFAHVAQRYANVLPGERLSRGRLNVCLSFDDGYYDFYARVFPLLRKHGLRALLAVPAGCIRDEVEGSHEERVSTESEPAFANPARGGFCTWRELREMVQSGHVRVAAHGFSHVRLDGAEADLRAEIVRPQEILAEKLGQAVDSFVFPYGRYSRRAWRCARWRYRHVFRIGGSINRQWDSLVYRVDADEMKSPASLFASSRMLTYRARYTWNKVRGR